MDLFYSSTSTVIYYPFFFQHQHQHRYQYSWTFYLPAPLYMISIKEALEMEYNYQPFAHSLLKSITTTHHLPTTTQQPSNPTTQKLKVNAVSIPSHPIPSMDIKSEGVFDCGEVCNRYLPRYLTSEATETKISASPLLPLPSLSMIHRIRNSQTY